MTRISPWHCRHYTAILGGIFDDKSAVRSCKAGVAYPDVRIRDAKTREQYPCFETPEGIANTLCSARSFLTAAEKEEDQRHTDEMVAAWAAKLTADICPHCDTAITKKRQVGPCVYAEPCGHRLYQGRLPAEAHR